MAHLIANGRERRLCPRSRARYSARVRFPGEDPVTVRCSLSQLSVSGGFLKLGNLRPKVGQSLQVALVAEDRGSVTRVWQRRAIVVRLAMAGVGIAFLRPASPWLQDKPLLTT